MDAYMGSGGEFLRAVEEDRFMGFLRNLDEVIDKSYSEATQVKGIDVVVEWDEGYGDYVLYLPQIDPRYAYEEGFNVSDQLMRLGSDVAIARDVFRETTEAAEETAGVYSLYETMAQKIAERSADQG